ncbi:MAG: hypothetical protein ACRDY3_02645, partial [Acidimicrobiales bacterium]
WSGLPLDPHAQFHSVALPPEPVDSPPPWSGQGPREGSLFPPDAVVVIEHLRQHTEDPERCWFSLWDGYGWQGARLTSDGSSSVLDDPIPRAVADGPRLRLPDRNYFFYQGPVDAALIGYPREPPNRTANLWWPEDRAWCVASEIDLSWTYVGGSAALVEALVSEPAIEALAITPEGPVIRTEAWIERWAQDALDALFTEGHALVRTPLGTVEAWLDLPRRFRAGSFRTISESTPGSSASGRTPINRRGSDDAAIRPEIGRHLQWDLIRLVGG